MVKSTYKYLSNILLVFLLSLSPVILWSQTKDVTGVWEGLIDTNKIQLVINANDDKINGYTIVYWPGNTVIENFNGSVDYNAMTLRAIENSENKGSGVFKCNISSDGNTLSGDWTRNQGGKSFKCNLNRKGTIKKTQLPPEKLIRNLISNINSYAWSRDPKYLKEVYNMWFTPEKNLGSLGEYIYGYNSTVSDSLVFAESLINTGLYSEVVTKHIAVDYRFDSDDYQTIEYETKYRLFNIDGKWEIKVNKLLNKNVKVSMNYNLADSIRNANLSAEIVSLLPMDGLIGDTISVRIASNLSRPEFNQMEVFFNDVKSVITSRSSDGVIKVIVPDLSDNINKDSLNPIITLHYTKPNSKKLFISNYSGFRIKTLTAESKTPWYIVGIILVLLFIALAFVGYISQRNSRLAKEKEILSQQTIRLTEEKQKISENISQFLDAGQEVIELPTPKVPIDLIEACKNGDCILFASSELSHQAGYPLWVDFIFNLINWSLENNYLTPDQRDLLISSIKSGRIEQAADSAITNLSDKGVDLTKYFSEVFLEHEPPIPEVYNYLNKIPFSAAVSGTFDNLLERSYNYNKKVLTAKDGEQSIASLNNRDFFIFKIYGDLKKPETILLAPSQFSDAVSQNYTFSQFIENVFNSRTVFCVGTNIDAIERFLKNVRFRGGAQKKHFALVGVKGTDWKTSAGILEKRFGIEVLPFTAGNNSQILDFVKELSSAVPNNTETLKKRPDAPIKKVKLENIGPFENLEIELDEHWNIFLGDNGVGKSSILKAIAIGLVGKEAESLSLRLIKKGKTSSKIILETDNATYTADIYLKINKAELNEHPRPIDTEGWLAIAFPPLRTITWKQTKGNTPDGSKVPECEDILPIITGEPDPRMDKLKEWIMKLYTKSLSIQKETKTNNDIYSKLITKFFQIVDDLTPNLMVKFSKVDPISNEVLIFTEDGEIPIEAISQGTLSLISWLGILIQRLYEVYGETEEDPTQRYALVIMDEIDAHMHPEWQHTLIYSLKQVFPNIQFIVSTHSPLVVGGMLPKQLFRFARNESGKVVRIEVEEEDTLGRTDQLLTSKLFGLNSTLDKVTQNDMNRYEELLGKSKKTSDEQKEFEKLESRLEFRIPPTFENPDSRKAQKQSEDLLKEQLKKIDFKDIADIKEKIDKYSK